MSETGYVYTLNDPRTGEPRYVGATIEPDKRLSSHLSGLCSSDVEDWIDELNEDGLSPNMTLVETTSLDQLPDAEQEVINRLAAEWDLLNRENSPRYSSNTASGTYGDDRKNIKVSPERFDELKAEKPDGVDWGYYLAEIRTVDAEGGDAGE